MFFVKPVRPMIVPGSGRAGEFWPGSGGLVGLAGGEHGEDDVAAAAGQADQGSVVAFAFGAFAVVERLGGGVARGGGGGQEHAGLAGDEGQSGVGGEFAAVGEGGAVADFGEDAGLASSRTPTVTVIIVWL